MTSISTPAIPFRRPVREGDRIRLLKMENDPDPIAQNDEGVVTSVNSIQIGVHWDSGRTLYLVPGVDKFEIIGRAAA